MNKIFKIENRNIVVCLALFSIALFLNSCKDSVPEKEPYTVDSLLFPKITTVNITDITKISAKINSIVTSEGASDLIVRGICWDTATLPTIDDFKTNDGINIGSSQTFISVLKEDTKYYVRSYAKNSDGLIYGNELSFITLGNPIRIGNTYQGGIIFYVDGTRMHGLIAASEDQGYAKWGCKNIDILSTSTELGKGDQSTSMIVNQCTDTDIAAKICYDLTLNGYSDWYLPTKDELNLIYQNLYLQGLGTFTPSTYWSSSQENKTKAWRQYFNQGVSQYSSDKSTYFTVRAIRSF